ncbi:MAG: type II secretion system protein GspL [Gammaproteobacteria bacterium]
MEKVIFTWRPASAVCDWLLLDHNGNRQGPVVRGGEPAELASAAGGRELLWLAPGAEALSLDVRLPVKGHDKVLRALPYALEESLAGEPERFFFALPVQSGGDTTHAIALDIEWLRSALTELNALGLAPTRVVPDYLALPWTTDSWSVLADAGMLYVRTAAGLGFTLEADAGWAILARRLEAEPETTRPQFLRYIRGREPFGPVPTLAVLQPEPEPVPEGLLGVVPKGLADTLPVNLLQGSFNPRREWRALARPWRPAAYALAAVIVLAFAGFVTSWIRDSSANSRLHGEIVARFHRILPNQPLVDIRTQVNQRLQTISGGADKSGMLPLLAVLAQANTADVEVESFTYQSGTLEVQLHAANANDLEKLRSAISERSGLPVAVRSVSQTKSGVEGGLGIGAGTGS